MATLLRRKLNGNYQDEMGNRFNTRIEGTRIKHTRGPVSIRMYDKFRASTPSIRRTRNCSNRWPAVSSTSANFRTEICDAG